MTDDPITGKELNVFWLPTEDGIAYLVAPRDEKPSRCPPKKTLDPRIPAAYRPTRTAPSSNGKFPGKPRKSVI